MRTVRWVCVVAVVATLAGCGTAFGRPVAVASDQPGVQAVRASPTLPASASPSVAADPVGTQAAVRTAPVDTLAVGVRQVIFARGVNRPLRTMVWYPASAAAQDAAPAVGAYPLVLFSHGLMASPEAYQTITSRIAGAGFIVAAPAYPYTNADATVYNPADLVNQPADGSAVISGMLALNATPSDPLAGHIDSTRIAAAGHSAGGYTTVGLLAGARDERLRSAIVIAGGSLGGSFTGPAAPVLFIHGDNDPVVTYAIGRAAYADLPWPKAFLTVTAGDHSSYLFRSGPAAAAVAAAMLDFLRLTLYDDATAGARLDIESAVAGATTYESSL